MVIHYFAMKWSTSARVENLLLERQTRACSFSGRFSYSTRTDYFAAATHNERRFQFRLVNRLFRVLPGFMGKSLVIAVRSSTERNNKPRSCTWAKRIYIWRLLIRCRAPLTADPSCWIRFHIFLWCNHTNMNTVFHLITPAYDRNPYIFKGTVFTKQVK